MCPKLCGSKVILTKKFWKLIWIQSIFELKPTPCQIFRFKFHNCGHPIEGLGTCDIVENVNQFQVQVDRYHHTRSGSSSGSRPDFFDYVNDEEEKGNSLIGKSNF